VGLKVLVFLVLVFNVHTTLNYGRSISDERPGRGLNTVNNFYLIIFSTMITLTSACLLAQPQNLTALESLQKVLPGEITVRPKLSLKENLATILAELDAYPHVSDSQSPLAPPDSNNLTNGWSSQKDRSLIMAILNHKDEFLAEASPSLQSYFTTRLKKALADHPGDLWESYFLLSKLFPELTFWLNPFADHLNQKLLDWSLVPNPDWTAEVLFTKLFQSKSNQGTWTKTLFLNLIGFLKFSWNHLDGSGSTPVANRIFVSALSAIDPYFELSDARTEGLFVADQIEVEKQFIELLRDLAIEISGTPTLSLLVPSVDSGAPQSNSLVIESLIINSLLLAHLGHRTQLTLDTPRVKAFFAKHDFATHWLTNQLPLGIWPLHILPLHKEPLPKSGVRDSARIRQVFESIFYLRTLLTLKTSLSQESSIISKGQWTSDQQYQHGIEIAWYDQLTIAQTEAMRMSQMTLYNLSLVDKCYREQLQTATCKSWREHFPLQYKEIVAETGSKRKVWELSSKVPVFIPAGQIVFAPQESLIIHAPEVHFSLLSSIIIPSGTVEIQASKINFPWIDVSGVNANFGFNSKAFPGQRPWIKNAKHCALRDYLEGTTFITLPRRQHANWVGFSIKNPFPKNVLICASDAQLPSSNFVGDFSQLLDLGLPPESTELIASQNGGVGGSIKIDLLGLLEPTPLLSPLLVAMGGDGSVGRQGQESPLCSKTGYQSFRVGLSHYKEEFQRWINATLEHPALKLVSKQEYGDHWYGLFEVNLPRTGGSDGGNAGAGGEITIKWESPHFEKPTQRLFLSAGIPGPGGKAGACGPNEVSDGTNGLTAPLGTLKLFRK
jgi:hypothetical protein